MTPEASPSPGKLQPELRVLRLAAAAVLASVTATAVHPILILDEF